MIYAGGGKRRPRNVPTPRKASAPPSCSATRRSSQLARWAGAIEEHYGCPMDMEWAKDGETGELFIVQARPETVQSRREAGALKSYTLTEQGRDAGRPGSAIGDAIVAGRVCLHRERRATSTASSTAPILVTDDDRSRLGADHEAGGRDRHRPWRAHLARRDRQPRARPAGDRRHRQRDRRSCTTDRRSRCPAPRATRASSMRAPPSSRRRDVDVGDTAGDAHRGHAQPRQSRRRRSAGGGCRPTASGWRAWSSSSATTSRSTRWRWSHYDS